MRIANLICLMAILIIAQPAFAQLGLDEECMVKNAVDLGDIKKDGLSLNGTLAPFEMKWFTFSVPEKIRFFLELSQLFSEDEYYYSYADLELVVYDENGKYVDFSGDTLLLDLLPGSYYIRIDARTDELINYTLSTISNFETEPNDGMSEANDLGIISGSLLFGGSIDPSGDADFFKFEVAEGQGGFLGIDTNSDSFNDLLLAIYSYNESKEFYTPENTGINSMDAFINPGTHYLRILDRSSDTCNYTVNISSTSLTCDEEPNDSFAEAISLGTLNATAPLTEDGCTQTEDDDDYFKFEVNESMSVTIKTITIDDTRLYLYDSDEERIAYNDDYYFYYDEDISDEDRNVDGKIKEDLEPGLYYIKVNSYGSGAEYRVTVEGKV